MELTKEESDQLKEILVGALFSELEELLLKAKQESFDDGRELGFNEGYTRGYEELIDGDKE